MKLGLLYETIEEPWGGVNTFFRNFAGCAEKNNEVELTNNFKNADLILSAGHYYAPGCLLKRYQLRNLSQGRKMCNPLGLFFFGVSAFLGHIDLFATRATDFFPNMTKGFPSRDK